jgi:hypothetical protein
LLKGYRIEVKSTVRLCVKVCAGLANRSGGELQLNSCSTVESPNPTPEKMDFLLAT